MNLATNVTLTTTVLLVMGPAAARLPATEKELVGTWAATAYRTVDGRGPTPSLLRITNHGKELRVEYTAGSHVRIRDQRDPNRVIYKKTVARYRGVLLNKAELSYSFRLPDTEQTIRFRYESGEEESKLILVDERGKRIRGRQPFLRADEKTLKMVQRSLGR